MADQIRDIIKQFIHTGILNKKHCEYSREEIVEGVSESSFTKVAVIQEIGTMAKEKALLKVESRGKKRITDYYTLPELLEVYKKNIKKDIKKEPLEHRKKVVEIRSKNN